MPPHNHHLQGEKKTYLLLHLPNLELMIAQLCVIHRLAIVPVLLRNDILHLPDERATRGGDSLARRLEAVLRLAHERRLHATRSHELRGASGDVVGRDDELLGAVAAGDDAVGRLDERVGRRRNRFGRADEALGPAVVFLVELRFGHAAPALAHDFLLRRRGRLDELRDGVCDGDGRVEDRVVDFELVRGELVARLVLQLCEAVGGCLDGVGSLGQLVVDDLAQVAVGVDLALGGEGVGELGQALQVADNLGAVVDDYVNLLLGIEVVHAYALHVTEESDGRRR